MPSSNQNRIPVEVSPQLKRVDMVVESEVVVRARHIVEQHSQLGRRSAGLQFAVDGEMLVVRGSVPTYYLKQLVQAALKGLEGVRQIDNQVEVVAGIQ